MTVKELKEELNNYAEELPVLIYDNYEHCHKDYDKIKLSTHKMKKVRSKFNYNYTTNNDKKGIITLLIN